MANNNITIKVVNLNTTISTHQYVVDSPSPQALHIKAHKGVNYVLTDDLTKLAPEKIYTERVGMDLHISFSENTDVIIEDYYDPQYGKDNLLIGLHINGNYYSYILESGVVHEAIYILLEHINTAQVIGGHSVPYYYSAMAESDGVVGYIFGVTAGTIAAVILAHKVSGKSKSKESEPADAGFALVEVLDDVGAYQGPIKSGDTTDDARPEFNGTAKSGSIVCSLSFWGLVTNLGLMRYGF